ncbi:hypothetical protein LTR42_005345 [Elasticomyces elasticus]|nr:hypothetical protein LTR42_005345 [Elasticomyces elasticus]
MRLLHRRDDGSVTLTHDIDEADEVPPYAILSHRWGNQEVTYADFVHGDGAQKAGYDKIQLCIEQAAKDGLEYVWIDTVCIDRSRSAELSEAIMSMFKWYQNAAICYVHLSDVSATEHDIHHLSFAREWEGEFRKSKWFGRTWTLQELLAPASVNFYSVEGTKLGDKRSLRQHIREVTGIPDGALQNDPMAEFTIGERLSWALARQSTRIEDKAYALLGILDVSMPIIYGEGDRAFVRLLQELEEASIKQRHLQNEQDQLIRTLPRSLSAVFDPGNDDHAPMCTPTTRVEVLRDISLWAEGSDNRNIYWLNGTAGTGKTTIARAVARRLHAQGTLGGSFFFSGGLDDAIRADNLVTTLASQLASRDPQMRQHICDAIHAHKDIAQSSLYEQWNNLIVRPFSKLKAHTGHVVLVIDGLDECHDEGRLSTIVRLLASLEVPSNAGLRLFVTSRPLPRIRQLIQSIPEAKRKSFVLHDIAPAMVERDLSLYVEERLACIERGRVLKPEWLDAQVIAELVDKATGVFLWVSTVCRYILKGGRLAESRMRGILQADLAHTSLDHLYATWLRESMLQVTDDASGLKAVKQRKRLLGTLAVLFRPLSIQSLATLLQTEPQGITDTLADLYMVVDMPSAHNEPVRFIHHSAREFLLSEARCSNTDFLVSEQDAHMALARSCVQLLSKGFPTHISNQSASGALDGDVMRSQPKRRLPPEVQYAYLYVLEHIQRSGAYARHSDNALVETRRLQWARAMCLVGESLNAENTLEICSSSLPPDILKWFDGKAVRALCADQHDDAQSDLKLHGYADSVISRVQDVSASAHLNEAPSPLDSILIPGTTYSGDNSDTHELGRQAARKENGLPFSNAATGSCSTERRDMKVEGCLSSSTACNDRNILPLRVLQPHALRSHTNGTNGTSTSSESGNSSTRAGVYAAVNSRSGFAGGSREGQGGLNEEGDGNEDKTTDGGIVKDTSVVHTSQMPCPCISPENGMCQGSDPNVSTMRRKLRSFHQFFDCDRCWDAFENKAALTSHDCLRCEPFCISAGCEPSGDSIASRKHARDKWKCPTNPPQLDAVEYWHYAFYGVAASVPFVLCDRNTKHNNSPVARVQRIGHAPPKDTEAHQVPHKRPSDEVNDLVQSTKKQRTTDVMDSDNVEDLVLTIGIILDHIENLPCRLLYALRQHVDVGCIPNDLLQTVCQISNSQRRMIKQKAPSALPKSTDELLVNMPQSKGDDHYQPSHFNGRTGPGARPNPQFLHTEYPLPVDPLTSTSNYQFQAPSDARERRSDSNFALPNDIAAHSASNEGDLQKDMNSAISDWDGYDFGDDFNLNWENALAADGEMLQ